ncbi:MAG: cyclic nucleotide-binding domain-containing protein, partial [Candidatus Rokuibacteriota bacterium]
MPGDALPKIVCAVLCKTLTAAEAEQIVRVTTPRTVPARGIVFAQGDEAEGLLLLLRGTVEILKANGKGGGEVIATVEAPT